MSFDREKFIQESAGASLQSNPNTETGEAKGVSVRKLYLKKRAEVLRESFEQSVSQVSNFVKEVESSSFNATRDELLFAKSLAWMQDNLHTDANIGDLADLLDVSVRKIQRLFSFFLKRTYTNVLLDMRMESAKFHLSQLKNSIGEVAYLVGIKDHAYFTYLFRKETGLTPTEFRTQLLEQSLQET